MSARIIRLNVGGEVFATSTSTLQSCGDSFFTGLLSGQFVGGKDETGAYFIDRSPEYFKPILNYLRTGNLDIPPRMSRRSLQIEADFYGIQKLVDYLKDRPTSACLVLKEKGFYGNEEDNLALMFSDDGKVVFLQEENMFAKLMFVRNHPKDSDLMPTSSRWRRVFQRDVAAPFINEAWSTYERGKYRTLEGNGLDLQVGHYKGLSDYLARLNKKIIPRDTDETIATLSDDATILSICQEGCFCVFKLRMFL